MKAKLTLVWIFRLILLTLLYFPLWILGTLAIGDLIPDTPSEPGLVSDTAAMLILGLSVPLLYIPLAILICKRWKNRTEPTEPAHLQMSFKQMALKLGVIALVYLALYWLAGYFIAWQNPELRAFYGSPGPPIPFFAHTYSAIVNTPGLILLQLFRGILFALIAMPIVRGSRLKVWPTALLVGLLFALPHLNHIMPNPLMPLASVRFSHMIETASSSFLFGLIVVWILHRK